jgi:outer membrane protein assembly factor BamB
MLSAPALMGSYVVVGDLEGQLHWLKREDGEIAARASLGGAGFGDGLVVVDEVLYVQSNDGSLGAFRLR